MKKTSIAAVVTAIVIVAGIVYVCCANNLKHEGRASNNASGQESSSGADGVSFGEYKYTLADNTINARYIKTGGTIKIYSVYPISSKDDYDISSDGSTAVCIGKDGQIWALLNDGTCKKVTPDTYGSIKKSQIEKQVAGYIWAEKPVLSNDGAVRFISDLPDTINPKESIWKIDILNSNMKKIYTPVSENYKYLGYRYDGRMMISDGQMLVAVNENDGSVQSIDAKGKYILNLSPDGEKVMYVRENNTGKVDYSRLYTMDGSGKNDSIMPGVSGYTGTSVGAWSSDSLKYAFVIRPEYSIGDKIAVISFDDDYTSIKTYSPEKGTKFPDSSKMSWSAGGSVSIDTGSDFINVDIDDTAGGSGQ